MSMSYGIFKHVDASSVMLAFDQSDQCYHISQRYTGEPVGKYYPEEDLFVKAGAPEAPPPVEAAPEPTVSAGALIVGGEIVVEPDVMEEPAPLYAGYAPAAEDERQRYAHTEYGLSIGIDAYHSNAQLRADVLDTLARETKIISPEAEEAVGKILDRLEADDAQPTIAAAMDAVRAQIEETTGIRYEIIHNAPAEVFVAKDDDDWQVNAPSPKSELEGLVGTAMRTTTEESAGDRVLLQLLKEALDGNICTLHFRTRDGVSVSWNG